MDMGIDPALRERAYARTYETSGQRDSDLPAWMHMYNWHRPPISRSRTDRDSPLGLRVPSKSTCRAADSKDSRAPERRTGRCPEEAGARHRFVMECPAPAIAGDPATFAPDVPRAFIGTLG